MNLGREMAFNYWVIGMFSVTTQEFKKTGVVLKDIHQLPKKVA
jgi:hypothetical protein